jgi:hypothetical protein
MPNFGLRPFVSLFVVEVIARFVAGKLLDLGYFTVQTLFVVNMFVGGICSIIFPFFRHMGINNIAVQYIKKVGLFIKERYALNISISFFRMLNFGLRPFVSLFVSSLTAVCRLKHFG